MVHGTDSSTLLGTDSLKRCFPGINYVRSTPLAIGFSHYYLLWGLL